MSIGKKLILSFMLIAAVAMSVATVSVVIINSLNSRFDTAVSKTVRKLQLGSELNNVKSDMYVAQRGLMLAAYAQDSLRLQAQSGEFNDQVVRMKAKLAEIHPLISVAAGRRLLSLFESDFSSWVDNYQPLFQACEAGHPDDAQRISLGKIIPIYKEMTTTGDQFVEVYREVLETDKQAARQSYRTALDLCLISFFALFIAGGVVVLIIRQVNRSLRLTVTELSDGAVQTASAASQISSTSQSLAQGASEQASSLFETSAATEEINSMARRNMENSRSAADFVAESQKKFVRTNEALKQTVAAMTDISEQSGRISKIIKTIDEIAFQTNILALNAAVEAARAGEAGMGFAVVADEVRNLAQRCTQAAKETADLIEESISKSSHGKTRVDMVAASISAITEEAIQVRTLVDQVNAGSQEQARGIEQIAAAIVQMQRVTQHSAASAEESASAAGELNAQSNKLKEIVEGLAGMVEDSQARLSGGKHSARNVRTGSAGSTFM